MIDELVAYLKANKPTDVKTVGKGWEAEPIESERDILPAVYVSHGDEDIEETDHDYVVGSWITQVARVDIVCLIDDLDTIKAAVRSSIAGWSESPIHTLMRPRGGHEHTHTGDVVWWVEEFYNEYQDVAT